MTPTTFNRQSQLIANALRELVYTDEVILVNFPLHRNVGDNLIWLGARQVLNDLGIRVVFATSIIDYSRSALQRYNNLPILITGGGNFGDLWPRYHRARLQIIADFPTRTLIQLPVSIFFERQEHVNQTQKVLRRAKNYHVTVRDAQSLQRLEQFQVASKTLLPDTAMGLRLNSQPDGEGTLRLMRMDREAPPLTENVDVTSTGDWNQIVPRRLVLSTLARRFFLGNASGESIVSFYDEYAWSLVRRAIALYSPYERIVTDRLHGMLLAGLLNKECRVYDNKIGKIGDYTDQWGLPPRTTLLSRHKPGPRGSCQQETETS